MLLNIAMFAQKCLMCDQKPGFLRKHSQRAIKHSNLCTHNNRLEPRRSITGAFFRLFLIRINEANPHSAGPATMIQKTEGQFWFPQKA
jgi:hypothetical protein